MSEVEVYEAPSHHASITDLAMLADRVARTSMVPRALRGKPDEVLAVMAYGNEVGFPPMQALQLIDFLNDRPVPNSQGKRALILRAGHELWVEERSDKRALVCGRRKGEDRVHSAEFTWQDATTAGLTSKDTYKKHPADMLVARATSILARVAFADVLMGMAYDADELEAGPSPVEVHQGPAYLSDDNIERFVNASAAEEIDAAEAVRLATDGRTDDPAEVYTSEVPRLRDAVKALSPYTAEADASEAVAEARTPPDVQKLSDPQRRKIMALYNTVGVTERADRLALARVVVEREDVSSISDLSVAEAGRLIEALEAVEAGRLGLVLGDDGSPVGVEA